MKIPDSNHWIKKLKAKTGISSDYKLSDTLNLSRARLSQISKGEGQFGPAAAVRTARMLDVEPMLVVASVMFHAASDAEQSSFWREVYCKAWKVRPQRANANKKQEGIAEKS